MPSIFKPNEHVEVLNTVPGAMVTGKVIAWCNPGPGDDGKYWLYTVLLDVPLLNYEWPGMTVPGAMLRVLSLLESTAIAALSQSAPPV